MALKTCNKWINFLDLLILIFYDFRINIIGVVLCVIADMLYQEYQGNTQQYQGNDQEYQGNNTTLQEQEVSEVETHVSDEDIHDHIIN